MAKAIDNEGALEVLRHGVKDRGITFRLAYYQPAHTIVAAALKPYGKNTLSVVRQFRYSAKKAEALDPLLSVNGVPVATAELKNPAGAGLPAEPAGLRQGHRENPAVKREGSLGCRPAAGRHPLTRSSDAFDHAGFTTRVMVLLAGENLPSPL
ncbi:type I restriction endonuclease [Streptosporangium sp. CA-135522]|uniref:type I restriction endonuclease n=1 Tax=Streptosporangium sp. CA-135522 TaxID=3240072 RepID=UPI003D8A5F5A